MNCFIFYNYKKKIDEQEFEVVETKGKGHPDNICDTLAEKISSEYSKFCIKKYGVILRHMIDKLSILGGGSKVEFKKGKINEPIKILVNGRFTNRYKNEEINYIEIIEDTIKEYMKELFPLLDISRDLVIIDNTHHNEGPGVVYVDNDRTNNERVKFFEVLDDKDALRHNNNYRCNDTSTTVSYYPISKLEKTVLEIEQFLNSNTYQEKYPWVGKDIKVMGIRKYNIIEITTCVPLISKYVKDIKDYRNKIRIINNDIKELVKFNFNKDKIKIYINTRDNIKKNDLYLTVIGSSIESGDEGVVGRGNRSRGVISFCRSLSMEAACGKNPVYHTGKLFSAIGDIISKKIYEEYGIENVVYCTSKMGDKIIDPWNISVELNCKKCDIIKEKIEGIIENTILNHSEITKDIIYGKIKLNSY